MTKAGSKIILVKSQSVVRSQGGPDKVLVQMANALQAKGYQVSVLTADMRSGKTYYKLDKGISFVQKKVGALGWFDRLLNGGTWRSYFKNQKPDLVIVADLADYWNVYDQTKAPVILMQHKDPHLTFRGLSKSQKRKVAKAAAVQVLLPCYQAVVRQNYAGLIAVIPNPVERVALKDRAKLDKKKKIYRVMMTGWICPDKQQDFLIKAFAKVATDHPHWVLDIVGAPKPTVEAKDYEETLKVLVKNFKLQGRVFFKGVVPNVMAELKTADIFAFPSKVEGLGLSMIEAMACGLPVLGLMRCLAVKEVIQAWRNGLLADGLDDFADKLAYLMDNAYIRSTMGNNAYEDAAKYSATAVWAQWTDLIGQVLSHENS